MIKIPLNLPLELIDFICEKIDRKLLVKSCCRDSPNIFPDNLLFFLNKNRIEKYWVKNNDLSDLIRDNDLYGVKYYHYEKMDFQTEKGKDSSLAFACQFDSFDVIKYLVKIGANIRCDNDTALMFACKWSSLKVVKFLVENGADITAQNNSSLYYACNSGNIEIVKYLVSLGADLREQDYWPIKTATANGNLNIVKYAVEIGIKFPVQCILKYAKSNDHKELIEYLEELIKKHSEISTDISGI